METMSPARTNRLHRNSAARFLASLESSCSLEELSQVDWESLVKVPHWCLAERGVSNRLQLTSGIIFLAPLIAQWVDGHRIKQVRALVGERVFELSMQAGANRATIDMSDTGDPVPELVASAGASVLVSSIDHSVIQKLLAEQFPMQVKPIDEQVARSLYQMALDVVDATQNTESRSQSGQQATQHTLDKTGDDALHDNNRQGQAHDQKNPQARSQDSRNQVAVAGDEG